MYNIALQIKIRDWLYILLIGIVFAMLLSSLGYTLLELSWHEGVLFGIILGFSITFFSLVFISFINHWILPKIHQRYWLPLAISFSFLSGFLGTIFSTISARSLSIDLIPMFDTEMIKIAIAIGVLTYIVGALLYRFVKMRNEKEVVDAHYTQSRLRSLERQLNPHFLFNALNSVAELIHHDPQKAEDAVLKISAFLRNTMKESALMSLQEELRNVRDYVELENIRFSGNILLHLPPQLTHLKVPKFSIQLLVENAIKHGVSPENPKLNITIEADPLKRMIIVENDGLPLTSKRFGIGLNNLSERLAHLCKGHLEVTSMQPPAFTLFLGDCYENPAR